MSEIDVEPVDDVAEESDDGPGDEEGGHEESHGIERDLTGVGPLTDAPEYVLYGGKGGVGKTTMAAATGLASAVEGTQTLVVSTDPAHSLSDVYERPIPDRPERIREDVPLWAVEIDPDAAVEEAAVFAEDGGGPLDGLGDALGGEGANPLSGGMPGADEAAAFQQLLRLLDDDRFDRVVVDTAPTGHTLRLLELPEIMDSMVGRFLRFRERLGGMMDGISGMFGGGEDPPEEGDFDDLRELSDRIERLRAVLEDPARTDFRVVMVPEEMSVAESERLLDRLAEFGIPAGTVVVNKVMENLVDVVREMPEGEFVSPDLENCEFCQRRWSVQQDALARAQEIFRGHDIRRVPLLAEEVRGERQLRIVALCLA